MAYRILAQINYSVSRNPEGDSSLHFTSGLLQALLQSRKDYHAYVLIPSKHLELWAEWLDHPRITLLPIEIEPRSRGGDFQFNPNAIFEAFKFRKFEVDCLFLNQPESASAYLHLFNKLLFHDVPAISYVHWFDTRGTGSKVGVESPALLSAISGMLVSDIVGCNSEFARNRIIAEAGKWLNEANIEALSAKIRILPPGISTRELEGFVPDRPRDGRKRIVVNHRLLKYTGVRDLLSITFPKLWLMRRDFEVTATNPSRIRLPARLTEAPWLSLGKYSRREYIAQLWNSDIVVAPHRSADWSISTLEAIYAGCIPLMNGDSFFPELMHPILKGLPAEARDRVSSHWFYSGNDLLQKLNYLLDNADAERQTIHKVSDLVGRHYDWSSLARDWTELFDETDRGRHAIAKTNPSLRRIGKMIGRAGAMSKESILRELAWGPQSSTLSWSAFRRRLRTMYVDDSSNSEVNYRVRKRCRRMGRVP